MSLNKEMMSTMALREQINKAALALKPLGDCCGLRFVWRFVDSDLLQAVPEEQMAHGDRFCQKVKWEPCRKLQLCIRDHWMNAFATALREQRPFIFRCHAGALELAAPVFAAGDFLGVLFAGPFADPGAPRLRALAEERAALPTADERKLLSLGAFLTSFLEESLAGCSLPARHSLLLPTLWTKDARILRAASHMRAHCKGRVTADEVAKAAGLSVPRLLHLFTQETGFSFSDWLQRLRVSEAQRLLEGAELPIGTIAVACGITDQSRMSVLFRRYLGKTPGQLRAKARSFREGRPTA